MESALAHRPRAFSGPNRRGCGVSRVLGTRNGSVRSISTSRLCWGSSPKLYYETKQLWYAKADGSCPVVRGVQSRWICWPVFLYAEPSNVVYSPAFAQQDSWQPCSQGTWALWILRSSLLFALVTGACRSKKAARFRGWAGAAAFSESSEASSRGLWSVDRY